MNETVYRYLLDRWKEATKPLRKGRIDFQMDDSENHTNADFRYVGDASEDALANGVSSEVYRDGKPVVDMVWNRETKQIDRQRLHVPLLDIDFEIAVIPSSTPGHWHLAMPGLLMGESEYMALLKDLAKYGVIQGGYAGASRRRSASWCRTPWAPKGAPIHYEIQQEQAAQQAASSCSTCDGGGCRDCR